MNLIDFHVQAVLSPVETKIYDWGTVYFVEVMYSDDGGDRQRKKLQFNTLEAAKAVKPGYVGQH